jgi:hypothetical protein
VDADDDGDEEEQEEQEEQEQERQALHEAAAANHARRHAGKQARAAIVGTASYQHTLMRVRTMGEEALARRIHAIARAKGKHAVIKMRLFARVLFLEGYEWLASEAAEALEGLIEELGDPEADEMEGLREGIAKDAADARDAGCGEFHCDASTDLSSASVYADVVRIEALASDEAFSRAFKTPHSVPTDDDGYSSVALAASVPKNATVWQAAAARCIKASGALPSGNLVTFHHVDGSYHVELATAEMKAAIKRANAKK